MGFTGNDILGCNSPTTGDAKADFLTTLDNFASSVDLHDHTTTRGKPLGASSFATGTITEANMAAGAFTTAKIAANAATLAKLYARATHATAATEGNVLLTAGSSTFSTTNTTMTQVTNLQGSIVCSGRPLFVGVFPTPGTSSSSLKVTRATVGLCYATLTLSTNSSLNPAFQIMANDFGFNVNATDTFTNLYYEVPPALFTIYAPGAGTVSLYAGVAAGSSCTIEVTNYSLFAWEL